MNSTTGIYSEFSKIFRVTISRGCFCQNIPQQITVYCCDWIYFSVIPIWHSKECFSAKFLVKRGTRTPCTACLRKRYYSFVRIASVNYVQHTFTWNTEYLILGFISLSFWYTYCYTYFLLANEVYRLDIDKLVILHLTFTIWKIFSLLSYYINHLRFSEIFENIWK